MRNSPVTIKDIAKRLHLSVSTVSYALNDGPKPVSEEVRIRVVQTAKEMDYRPNRLAKSLVTRTTHSIGVVPPKLHRDMLLSPFIQQALNGIVNVAEELHQDLVLFTGSERNRPDSVANDLLDSRIDGVIFIAPHAESQVVELLADRNFPFAVVASGRNVSGPGFEIDNECGATLLLEHLWQLGHRRIAHVAGRHQAMDSRARTEAYLSFMQRKGLDVPPEYVLQTDFFYQGGYDAAPRLLSLPEPPTAIFAANDDTALGVIDCAKNMGRRIPEDLSVVGFDDTEAAAKADPPLTSVRQPVEEMGARAMRAVVARVQGLPVEGHRFPTALVIRQSTCPPKSL